MISAKIGSFHHGISVIKLLVITLVACKAWTQDCITVCTQNDYRSGTLAPCSGVCTTGYTKVQDCCCTGYGTPIVIDTDGSGFHLTNARDGVVFDLVPGVPEGWAWTSQWSTNAWLVLDRNHNGKIDDGSELFGNFTPQPPPPPGKQKNGFLALAIYDKAINGGNEDGVIDGRDAIYSSLRLWIDANHDGKSSPDELHTLPSLGVAGIELKYSYSEVRDEFGNLFHLKARVLREDGSHDGRWAYDVTLRFEHIDY